MIERLHANELSVSEFDRKFFDRERPLLIEDETRDWKATQTWDPEYFHCMFGNIDVQYTFNEEGIFDYTGTHQTGDIEVDTLPFSDVLQRIREDGRYYLNEQQIDILSLNSVLKKLYRKHDDLLDDEWLIGDIKTPRFLHNWSRYLHAVNLWFGGDLCKTPLHFDGTQNFVAQIDGQKRFTLFPPSQTEYLYPARGNMPRFSRVNIFAPDLTTFPRYEQAEPEQIVLEPGDLLFLPQGWWHAVESLSTAISVNFWFSQFSFFSR